jgi:hypothetical protein
VLGQSGLHQAAADLAAQPVGRQGCALLSDKEPVEVSSPYSESVGPRIIAMSPTDRCNAEQDHPDA